MQEGLLRKGLLISLLLVAGCGSGAAGGGEPAEAEDISPVDLIESDTQETEDSLGSKDTESVDDVSEDAGDGPGEDIVPPEDAVETDVLDAGDEDSNVTEPDATGTSDPLCLPCFEDADCALYLEGSRCMSHGDEGSFCGIPCEGELDCPASHVCVSEDEPDSPGQCVLADGVCECSEFAISEGLETFCEVSNTHGNCSGVRQCTVEGLSECGAPIPAAETCDGLDNDCSGVIDDGLGEITCGLGECAQALESCADGVAQECDPFAGSTNEICDGFDNDCDGEVDEELGEIQCGEGICEQIYDFCIDGSVQGCNPFIGKEVEVCDGLDNDCDGLTDDHLSLSCGLGECAKVIPGCVNAEVPICDAFAEAVEEVCDGLDNDCDGEADEALGSTSCGQGGCEKVVANCVNGASQICEAFAEAVEEVCDGLDNDCDGEADEGFGAVNCGVGACAKELLSCVGGEPQLCDPLAGSSEEACDGLDNDCDGETDEGFGTLVCGVGACAAEVSSCLNGEIQICEPLEPAPTETCDGLDNDCDGETDEGIASIECGLGECAKVVLGCVNAEVPSCDPFAEASEEVCDGEDNDCDGDTDELGTVFCGQGVCALVEQLVCVDGTPQECDPFAGVGQEICDGTDNDCDGDIDEGSSLCADGDNCTLDLCNSSLGTCDSTVVESPACGFECTPTFEHIGGASLFGRGVIADVAQAGPSSMVTATNLGVSVFGISTWTQLKAMGQWVSPHPVSAVAMTEDDFVVAAMGVNGMAVLHISDPENPVQIGELAQPADRVGVANGVAVASFGSDVAVVDLNEMAAPGVYATFSLPSPLEGQSVETIYRVGEMAYLAVGQHVLFVDVSVPTAPVQVALLDTGAPVRDLLLVNNTLHVANDLQGLTSVDVTLPGNPTIIESLPLLINDDTTVSSVSFLAQVEDQVVAYQGPVGWITTFPILPGENLLGAGISSGGSVSSNAIAMVSKNGIFYLLRDDGDISRLGIKNDGSVGPMGSFISGNGSVDALEVSGTTAILSLDDVGFELVDLSDEKEPVSLGFVSHSGTGYATLAGNYAYVGTKKNMDIFDVSDPGNPVKLGNFYKAAGGPARISVVDDLAYLAWASYGSNVVSYYKGLRIVDISDPSNPVQVGMDSGWDATDLHVDLPHVYVASNSKLRIIDVSDPTDPEEINSFNAVVGNFGSVAKSGNFVYALDYDQLTVIDVSDPTNATKVLNVKLDSVSLSSRLEAVGDFVYALTNSDLYAVDVSDPSQPVAYENNSSGKDLVVYGKYLLRTGGGGLSVIDISEPAHPSGVSASLSASEFMGFSTRVLLEGDFAYVADDSGGLRVLDIQQPNEPKALAQYGVSSAKALVKHNNYVVVSHEGGIVSVNVSNPEDLDVYDSTIFGKKKKDLALKGNYLLVPDGNDFEVYSVPSMNLKTFDNGAKGGRLTVAGDILYTNYSGELYIYDVTDVQNAVLLYEQPSPGDPPIYDLVATGTTLVTVAGPYEGGVGGPPHPGVLTVWNVAVPSAPVVQGIVEFDALVKSLSVSGDMAYVSTGDDVLVFDIGDPSAPDLLATLSTAGAAQEAVAHGPHVYVADGDHYLQTWQVGCQ